MRVSKVGQQGTVEDPDSRCWEPQTVLSLVVGFQEALLCSAVSPEK